MFFENLLRKFKYYCNVRGITGTLLEDLCAYMIVSCRIPLKMRNISDRSCRKNQDTCIMFDNFFLKVVMFMR